jgi:hypothetical protein
MLHRATTRCIESGEALACLEVAPPKPRIEQIHVVDMFSSNAWVAFAGIFAQTRSAHPSRRRRN